MEIVEKLVPSDRNQAKADAILIALAYSEAKLAEKQEAESKLKTKPLQKH